MTTSIFINRFKNLPDFLFSQICAEVLASLCELTKIEGFTTIVIDYSKLSKSSKI